MPERISDNWVGAHFDRDGIAGNRRKLERAGLEPFVPDVMIPPSGATITLSL